MIPNVWAGVTPRRWQGEALQAVLNAWRRGVANPLVYAATGAGKSRLIGAVAASGRGSVLISTPSQSLVEQLAATLAEHCSSNDVGRAYQHTWQIDRRVTVTCNASLDALLAERNDYGCWICDEAHRIEADALRGWSSRIQRKVSFGLTATPFRADGRGLASFDELVYSYNSGQAIADGVLVPWRAVRWDGSGEADTDAVCEGWVRHAEGPGIVSAVSIADAEAYAARLSAAGIPAEAIHQRLPRGERELRIRRLRSGRTKALVHVALLVEGVDLPFLRWLCLRRPVSSPVRLVQEVGRVLRSSEGKTEAVLFDPHDLLGELGLVHAAALEDAQRRETAPSEDVWSIPELEGLDEVSRLPAPKAVSTLAGWVTDLLGLLRMHDLVPPPKFSENAKWRRNAATDKQRAALARWSWAARYLPDPRHRKAVRWVIEQPDLRSGTASDLMDVLKALATVAREAERAQAPWSLPCAVPAIEVAA